MGDVRLKIATKTLARACKAASKVLAAKPIKPTLACFRLCASGGKLTIEATDLEISILLSMDTEDSGEEEFLLTGKLLENIVKSATSEHVSIAIKKDQALLDVGAAFTLNMDGAVKDFPRIKEPKAGRASVRVAGKALAAMLDKTSFSVADSGAKYCLQGIALVAVGGMFNMLASDSTGLAWVTCPIPAADMPLCSVPVAAMEAICGLVADDEEDIELWTNDVEIHARCGDGLVSARLYEGKYPSLEMIQGAGMGLPPQSTIEMSAGEFSAALKQVGLVQDLESRAIKGRILADRLELWTESATGKSAVSVKGVASGSGAFAFDAPRVIKAAETIKSDSQVSLGWNGKKPMSLRCGEWSYWIQPIG